MKLQQLKKFLRERKKLLKKSYLKKIIEQKKDDPININQHKLELLLISDCLFYQL